MDKEYRVIVSFTNKESEQVKVTANSNYNASVLALSRFRHDEIVGVKITYIGQEK